MWEAVALPVNPWNVSRQESVPPARLRTSVALNVPAALARTPAGFGTSCAALSFAMKPVLAAVAASCAGDAEARPDSCSQERRHYRGAHDQPLLSHSVMITRGRPHRIPYRTTKDVVRMRVFGRIGPTFSMFRVSW